MGKKHDSVFFQAAIREKRVPVTTALPCAPPVATIFMDSQPLVIKIMELQKQNYKGGEKMRPLGTFCVPVVDCAVVMDAAINASANRERGSEDETRMRRRSGRKRCSPHCTGCAAQDARETQPGLCSWCCDILPGPGDSARAAGAARARLCCLSGSSSMSCPVSMARALRSYRGFWYEEPRAHT